MSPLDLLAWVGAVAGSIVLVCIAIAIIVALVRNIRNPQPATKKPTPIMRGGGQP